MLAASAKFKTALFASASVISICACSVVQKAHAQTAPAPAASGDALKTILDGAPGSITMAGLTVYGTLDVNAVYQNHGTPRSKYAAVALQYPLSANSNRSQFQYGANGLSQSFIGLKGEQKLGNLIPGDALSPWSVGFDLQAGFNPLTGQIANGIKSVASANGVPLREQDVVSDSSRAGQVFNGDALAYLKHKELGELKFGRQTTVAGDAIGQYDPQRSSYAFSPIGFFGAFAGGIGATELVRWNNSLKYKNSFGPLRVSAQYRFEGGGQGGDAYAVGAGIDFTDSLKGLHIDGFWGHLSSGIVASPLSTPNCQALAPAGGCSSLDIVNATVSKNDAFGVMARYEISALTVYGGWQQITFSNGADYAGNMIQGGFLLNPLNGGSSINYFRNLTDRVQNVAWVGARYAFTSKVSGALGYYYIDQNNFLAGTTNSLGGLAAGSAATCQQATVTNQTVNAVRPTSDTRSTAGLNQTGSNCAGRSDVVSASVTYQMTQRLDLYAGIQWFQTSGGLASGFLNNSTIDPQIGARYRF